MAVKSLAEEITGFSPSEFRESDVPRLVSREQLFEDFPIRLRQSVRLAAGLTVTSGELDEERERLAQKRLEISKKYDTYNSRGCTR